jgi:hypothetical protein
MYRPSHVVLDYVSPPIQKVIGYKVYREWWKILRHE